MSAVVQTGSRLRKSVEGMMRTTSLDVPCAAAAIGSSAAASKTRPRNGRIDFLPDERPQSSAAEVGLATVARLDRAGDPRLGSSLISAQERLAMSSKRFSGAEAAFGAHAAAAAGTRRAAEIAIDCIKAGGNAVDA